jgi:hypothetical protein
MIIYIKTFNILRLVERYIDKKSIYLKKFYLELYFINYILVLA